VDLSYNVLATLPPSLVLLGQLKRLNLRGNQLKTLPNGIERLVGLQQLDIRNNAFDKEQIERIRALLSATDVLY